jgi:hypothetical protein
MKGNLKRKYSLIFHLLRRVYYPGSGKDLETLSLVLSQIKFVEDIIFCDYLVHLELEELSRLQGWEVLKVIPLTPMDFKKDSWTDFWYDHENSKSFAAPGQISSNLFILHNIKSHKIVRFFQLGTEGVGTYKALRSCGLRPNLIILADHGFGGNWNPNIWGEPSDNDLKVSYLKSWASENRFILVDNKSTRPWLDYSVEESFENPRWEFFVKNMEKHK